MSQLPRPCLVCGTPTTGSRCEAHALPEPPKAPRAARGYDKHWVKLSKLARHLSPVCAHCGTREDLTCDHLRWPAVTLSDVQVLCRRCNSRKGAVRRGVTPPGGSALTLAPRPNPRLTGEAE